MHDLNMILIDACIIAYHLADIMIVYGSYSVINSWFLHFWDIMRSWIIKTAKSREFSSAERHLRLLTGCKFTSRIFMYLKLLLLHLIGASLWGYCFLSQIKCTLAEFSSFNKVFHDFLNRFENLMFSLRNALAELIEKFLATTLQY